MPTPTVESNSGSHCLEQGVVVAFKEWALVCDSMLKGETSLVFRKGGIAEGRAGFRFKHQRFFLFPTYFHEQAGSLRLAAPVTVGEAPPEVTIQGLAQVEFTSWVDDLGKLAPLSGLHILRDRVLEQRFQYSEPKGLYLAFVRVFRWERPWRFPSQRSFGGCRSWLELPGVPPDAELVPVLSEEEQTKRRDQVRALFPVESEGEDGVGVMG
ncbi:MAG TPA: DUF1802 family protein [Chthoniobacterales bacterium]